MSMAQCPDRKKQIIEQYKSAYKVLAREHDLSPNNPVINETLHALVKSLGACYGCEWAADIASDEEIRKVRPDMLQKLGQAETLMEFYYAEKLLAGAPHLDYLQTFLYWENYEKLVENELQALFAIIEKRSVSSIAFVGSGPLPLSALLLQRQIERPVVCIDIDEKAHAAGKKLIDAYGWGETVRCVLADGAHYDYRRHDIVWIASLVPNKEEVIERVYEINREAIIAIRSVDGIYELLYEPVDVAYFRRAGCQKIGDAKANRSIINSTVFIAYNGLPTSQRPPSITRVSGA
ncbi:nicotianamine synthase [Geobacillus sp. BMUD]|uniref:nicotianamine synthase family protein n=1 Tax=Geobacillus sp. BMUD TaxID=2508876 RepID=UPI00149176E3|nr:nicotianamine synthase family protein [Geobacillus sp. BMUD]NNU82520.1 nicotianamine synthase [Geobacillus sp. BMUD]